MGRNQIYQYYVEGETDKKMVDVLKTEYRVIIPGKTRKFNVINERLTRSRLIDLSPGTIVVLVFDTDVKSYDILIENIEFLKSETIVKDVICITQVGNLEDELVRSCNIKYIKELTGSRSNKEFKGDMLKINNLKQKLDEKGFDFKLFWVSESVDSGAHIPNEANKIKK